MKNPLDKTIENLRSRIEFIEIGLDRAEGQALQLDKRRLAEYQQELVFWLSLRDNAASNVVPIKQIPEQLELPHLLLEQAL